jgi:hypothetical protein
MRRELGKMKKIAGITTALLMMGSVCTATVTPRDVDVDMPINNVHANYVNEVDDGYVKIIELEHQVFVREPSNSNTILQIDYKGYGHIVNGITVGSKFDQSKVTNATYVASWRHGAMVYYTYVRPDNSLVRFNTIAQLGTVESITRISKTLNDIAGY